MSDQSNGSGFSWFLAGLGLGSLLGVLYAPKSGRETRDEIVANAMGSAEQVKQRSREVGGQVTELVERGKGKATDYVERGKDYVDIGKSKINDAVNQGRQVVNEQTTKVSAAFEAGKQAYKTTTAEPVEPIAVVE